MRARAFAFSFLFSSLSLLSQAFSQTSVTGKIQDIKPLDKEKYQMVVANKQGASDLEVGPKTAIEATVSAEAVKPGQEIAVPVFPRSPGMPAPPILPEKPKGAEKPQPAEPKDQPKLPKLPGLPNIPGLTQKKEMPQPAEGQQGAEGQPPQGAQMPGPPAGQPEAPQSPTSLEPPKSPLSISEQGRKALDNPEPPKKHLKVAKVETTKEGIKVQFEGGKDQRIFGAKEKITQVLTPTDLHKDMKVNVKIAKGKLARKVTVLEEPKPAGKP